MTCEQLIEMISNIDEKYVLDYFEFPTNMLDIEYNYVKKWVAAACVVLLIGVLAIHVINKPQEYPSHGKVKEFVLYQEFMDALPKESLLRNVTQQETVTYKYMGNFENINSDKFLEFSISVIEKEQILTHIYYEPSSDMSAEKYARLNGLSKMQTINVVNVYYIYDEHGGFYEAVFMNEYDLYRVEHYVNDEQELLDIVKDILE